jgi:ubiquinone/menaquinone biosynthesis C-methylase UbiE
MSKDNLIIETFSELAPRYENVVDLELNRFWGWRYDEFVDYLIDMTPIEPDDSLLDIATGTTVIPRKIADRFNINAPIHGLDITFEMLRRARKIILSDYSGDDFCLVCASGLSLPYRENSFDVALCGLATHHMDARVLLSEINRVLKQGGNLGIADVGGSLTLNLPIVRFFYKVLTFFYYLFHENISRAWTEANSITNIRTFKEWNEMLIEFGFEKINITQMRSKYVWIPKPILIRASKINF